MVGSCNTTTLRYTFKNKGVIVVVMGGEVLVYDVFEVDKRKVKRFTI